MLRYIFFFIVQYNIFATEDSLSSARDETSGRVSVDLGAAEEERRATNSPVGGLVEESASVSDVRDGNVPTVVSITASQDSVFSRSRRQGTTDKEALELPDEAPYAPGLCIVNFKRCVASMSHISSFTCRILSGLCATLATVGVGNYLSGDSIFDASTTTNSTLSMENAHQDKAQDPSLTTMLSIWGGIGSVFFKSLELSLKSIGDREEIRLLSYERILEEIAHEEEQRDISDEKLGEIREFMRARNKFITLPGRMSYSVQSFCYNGLCILESVSELLVDVCTSLTGATMGSGVSNVNLLRFDTMEPYKRLSLILGLTTATIYTLEKKRKALKSNCEEYLVNHRMARLYLVYIQGIARDQIFVNIQALPMLVQLTNEPVEQ